MSYDKCLVRKEVQYYESWIERNPELFAESATKFITSHPEPFWKISVKSASGCIYFTAVKV